MSTSQPQVLCLDDVGSCVGRTPRAIFPCLISPPTSFFFSASSCTSSNFFASSYRKLELKEGFKVLNLEELQQSWDKRPCSHRCPTMGVFAWTFGLIYAFATSWLTLVYGLQLDLKSDEELASLQAITGIYACPVWVWCRCRGVGVDVGICVCPDVPVRMLNRCALMNEPKHTGKTHSSYKDRRMLVTM
jgi:hypothetical protein